jgi:hypothetical protein
MGQCQVNLQIPSLPKGLSALPPIHRAPTVAAVPESPGTYALTLLSRRVAPFPSAGTESLRILARPPTRHRPAAGQAHIALEASRVGPSPMGELALARGRCSGWLRPSSRNGPQDDAIQAPRTGPVAVNPSLEVSLDSPDSVPSLKMLI